MVNRTPHIAVSVVALATLVPALVLALRGVAVFDIFGWIGSFASYGFILSYILVSLAAPIYLYTHHSPSIATVVSAVAAIVLLLIALVGNLYPVPAAPYNWLPYLFSRLSRPRCRLVCGAAMDRAGIHQGDPGKHQRDQGPLRGGRHPSGLDNSKPQPARARSKPTPALSQ